MSPARNIATGKKIAALKAIPSPPNSLGLRNPLIIRAASAMPSGMPSAMPTGTGMPRNAPTGFVARAGATRR